MDERSTLRQVALTAAVVSLIAASSCLRQAFLPTRLFPWMDFINATAFAGIAGYGIWAFRTFR